MRNNYSMLILLPFKRGEIMSSNEEIKVPSNPKPLNPRDLYYNCITACSLNDDGIECLTECVTTYYQDVLEK